jgi:hypothetical protein
MAILAAMQSAAMRLMGQRPSVFFGSSNKFEQEIADLVNEVAIDVQKYDDWQALTKIHTIVGDGVTTEVPLPADYDRQLVDSAIQDTVNWAWGYQHLSDINDYIYRSTHGFEPYPGGWIIYGNRMHFTPAPRAGASAVFPYINKNYATGSTGTPKASFTMDSDSFLLPERLLTLGLVWRWRENKKLDASGDQEAFIKALDEYASKDRGSSIYRTGRTWRRGNFSVAYPWPLG